jgi:hypothetical protein
MLVVNPFPSIFISEDKSILALLMDREFADDFDADEHEAIRALVPETYRLRDQEVEFENEKVDLVRLLKERKDDFLIKAQMESMGRDIVIGRDVDSQRWDDIIDKKLGGMFVAQRFIEEKPIELLDPSLETDSTISMYYTLALFFMGGRITGMFNRVSPKLVTNVAQGGAYQEVFIYE